MASERFFSYQSHFFAAHRSSIETRFGTYNSSGFQVPVCTYSVQALYVNISLYWNTVKNIYFYMFASTPEFEKHNN
jgi:hypothetical protein